MRICIIMRNKEVVGGVFRGARDGAPGNQQAGSLSIKPHVFPLAYLVNTLFCRLLYCSRDRNLSLATLTQSLNTQVEAWGAVCILWRGVRKRNSSWGGLKWAHSLIVHPGVAAVTFQCASHRLLFCSWVVLREMGLDTAESGDLPSKSFFQLLAVLRQ